MDYNSILFVVKDNNNFFKLELAKTILHLCEFDFTYFWERCIEAGAIAKKTGRLPTNNINAAKSIIAGLHPYIDALIADDFSDIVIDCIIEYICRSERLSQDELWVRCISAKNNYESAIFNRISKYKSFKAINQWENIIRIQQYAQKKLEFIFSDDDIENPISSEIIKTRSEYFNLATAVAANEMGIAGKYLPSVKVSSASLLRDSTFRISKVSTAIYRRLSDNFKNCPDYEFNTTKDNTYIKDKLALDAYDFVMGLTYPAALDMNFAVEALRNFDDKIYMPDSFKAIIDLEFDLLVEKKIVLRRCLKCGRYFIARDELFYCDRVNSSGLSCLEQFIENNPDYDKSNRIISEQISLESSNDIIKAAREEISKFENDDENLKTSEKDELISAEKRGQKIYNLIYKKVGKGISSEDFHIWSGYFSNIKRLGKSAEISSSNFNRFNDYSDYILSEIKKCPKGQNYSYQKLDESSLPAFFNSIEDYFKLASEISVPRELELRGQNLYDNLQSKIGNGLDEKEFYEWNEYLSNMKKNIKLGEAAIEQLSDFLDYSDTLCSTVKSEVSVIKTSTENSDTVIIKGKESKIKAFTPMTFDSLDDAVKATPKFFDDDEKEEIITPSTEDKKVVIKEPQWVRLTRAEAYGKKDGEV